MLFSAFNYIHKHKKMHGSLLLSCFIITKVKKKFCYKSMLITGKQTFNSGWSVNKNSIFPNTFFFWNTKVRWNNVCIRAFVHEWADLTRISLYFVPPNLAILRALLRWVEHHGRAQASFWVMSDVIHPLYIQYVFMTIAHGMYRLYGTQEMCSWFKLFVS